MEIAMLLFPRLTQLDLTGPHEVLVRVPGARVELVAATREPVMSESGMAIVPTVTFADVLNPHTVFVPGGYGQIAAIDDGVTLPWLRTACSRARWVTAACTGTLLLGAAGLLRGYHAATHWGFMDLLPAVGAIPTEERVVIDRDRITGGGVTAGIDIALALAERLANADVAADIALHLEYDPRPAYPGHPRTADPERVARARAKLERRHEERRAQLERVMRTLS
jgi:cyclohexyl-isocyanide hydratase